MISALRARNTEEDGFTLIELLVVVIIIGILAAIAIPAFLNQRENAWAASVESDLRNVAIEVESSATRNNGQYVEAAVTAAIAAAQLSDNVVITLISPAAGTTTTSFCMEGSHALLSAGTPGAVGSEYAYDSSAGGLDNSGAGC